MEQKLFFNKKINSLTKSSSYGVDLLAGWDFADPVNGWNKSGENLSINIIDNDQFNVNLTNSLQNYGIFKSIFELNTFYTLKIKGNSKYDSDNQPASFIVYNKPENIKIFCLIEYNSKIYAGSNNGNIYKSDDGITWTKIKTASLGGDVTAFGKTSTSLFFGTSNCQVYKLTGSVWDDPKNIFGNYSRKKITCISTTNNAEVYVGVYGDVGVYRSLDNGNTWGGFKNGTGINTYFYTLPQEWYVTSLLYINTDEIYVSVDDWSSEYYSPPNNSPKYSIFKYALYGTPPMVQFKYWKAIGGSNTINKKVKTLAKNQSTGNLFFGTYGTSFDLGGIFCSTDDGVSWIQANDGLNASHDINQIFEKDGDLYAATSSSIFKSVNDGVIWTQKMIQNFPNIYSVNFINSIVLVGTDNRLFGSNDVGEKWNYINMRLIVSSNEIGINKIYTDGTFEEDISFKTGNTSEHQNLYLQNCSSTRFNDPITTTIEKLELYYGNKNNFIKYIGLGEEEGKGFLLPKKEILFNINIVNNFITKNLMNLYTNPVDFSLIISKIENTNQIDITDINNNYLIYIGQLNENKRYDNEVNEVYKKYYMISLENLMLPQEIDPNTNYYLHLLANIETLDNETDCNISVTGIGYQL